MNGAYVILPLNSSQQRTKSTAKAQHNHTVPISQMITYNNPSQNMNPKRISLSPSPIKIHEDWYYS